MSPQVGEEFSFSRVLISGAGFLADAYDLFVINVALDLMNDQGYKEELTTGLKSAVTKENGIFFSTILLILPSEL